MPQQKFPHRAPFTGALLCLVLLTALACTSPKAPSDTTAPTPVAPATTAPTSSPPPPSPSHTPHRAPPPTPAPSEFSLAIPTPLPPATLFPKHPPPPPTATSLSPARTHPSSPTPAPSPGIQTIEIRPAYISITPPPGTVRAHIVAKIHDGTSRPLTPSEQSRVTWQSTTQAPITVTSDGTVAARGEGETLVTATLGDLSAAAIATAWGPLDPHSDDNDPNRPYTITTMPRILSDLKPGDSSTVRVLGVHINNKTSELTPDHKRRLRFWSTNPQTIAVDQQGTIHTHQAGGADIVVSVLGTSMETSFPVLAWAPFQPVPHRDGYCSIDLHQDGKTWVNAHRIDVFFHEDKHEYRSKNLLAHAQQLAQSLDARIVFVLNTNRQFTMETSCPPGDADAKLTHLDHLMSLADQYPGVTNVATTPARLHDGIGKPSPAVPAEANPPATPPPGQPSEIYLHPRTETLRLHHGDSILLQPRAAFPDGSDVAIPLDARREARFEVYPATLHVERDGVLTVSDYTPTDNYRVTVTYRGRNHDQDVTVRKRQTDHLHVTNDCHTNINTQQVKLDIIAAHHLDRYDEFDQIADDTGAQLLGPLIYHHPAYYDPNVALLRLPCNNPYDFHSNIQKVRQHPKVAQAWPHTTPQADLLIYDIQTKPASTTVYPGQEKPITLTTTLTDMSTREIPLSQTAEWDWWSDNPQVAVITDHGKLKALTPGVANLFLSTGGITRDIRIEVTDTPVDNLCRAWLHERQEHRLVSRYFHLDRLRFTMKRGATPQDAHLAASQAWPEATAAALDTGLPRQPTYLLSTPCDRPQSSYVSHQELSKLRQAIATLRDHPKVHKAHSITDTVVSETDPSGAPPPLPHRIPTEAETISPYQRDPQGPPIGLIAYPASGYPGEKVTPQAWAVHANGAITQVPQDQLTLTDTDPTITLHTPEGDLLYYSPGLSLATAQHKGITALTGVTTKPPIAEHQAITPTCAHLPNGHKMAIFRHQVVLSAPTDNRHLKDAVRQTGGTIIAHHGYPPPDHQTGWTLVEYPCNPDMTALEEHPELAALQRHQINTHLHTITAP